MLSFEPAASTRPFALGFASIAIAGSFCLFCENGVGGLPVVTSASVTVTAAEAGTANKTARAAANNTEALRMAFSP
jgi:hypothetical protein